MTPDAAPVPTGSPSPTRLVVSVTDEQDAEPVDTGRWHELAQWALAAEGLAEPADQPDVELSVTFVDPDTIADLNRRFLDGDGPTDVLAFPIDEEADTDDGSASRPATGPPRVLGDVVICPAVARANAPDHAGTYDDELALLLVHGILHLLGMDHADDDERRVMQERERQLLDSFHRR